MPYASGISITSFLIVHSSARIRFVGPQGNESGPTFSPALFYVGTRSERFEEVFAGICVVLVVLGKGV